MIASSASAVKSLTGLAFSSANSRRKLSANIGMSEARSRSGGAQSSTTPKRKKRSSRNSPLPTISLRFLFVAATNKNLKEMVGNGEFREDLYFRLSVVELWAPPLRERASDIPMLALSFLREFAEENAKPVSDFTAEALEAIIRYAWPGNVRELRTAVEHAVVLGRGDMIELAGLPQSVQSRGVIQHEKQWTQPLVDKGVTLEEAEKQLIIRTLKECRGNRTTAARKIGISRRTLHRKLNRYGLEGI